MSGTFLVSFFMGCLIMYGFLARKDLKKLKKQEGDMGFRRILLPPMITRVVLIIGFLALVFYFCFMTN